MAAVRIVFTSKASNGMKNHIIIISAAWLLTGQTVMAQELSKAKDALDTIAIAESHEAPRLTMPASPWNTLHARQPYPAPVPPVSNDKQPFSPDGHLLSRGSNDPLQTTVPLKSDGNHQTASIMNIGGWHVVGSNGMDRFPGMMETASAAVGLRRSFGHLTVNVEAATNRYHANIMDNPVLAAQGIHSDISQYGVGGSLSMRLDDNWSITAYGQYYSGNPYFFMAAFPYVHTSTYGAYATYTNGWFGMDMGTRRYYDAFGRRWITEPIVTPKFKLGNKVWLELPVGGLVRHGMETIVHPHRNGPTIMPSTR